MRDYERLLASSLKLYEEGNADLPLELIEEVQGMRADCNAKFKALMASIGKR